MTASLSPNKDTHAFYLDLAVHLRAKRPAIETIGEMVRLALALHPLAPAGIRRLRDEAEVCVWHAPRQSWALAQIVYIAAQERCDEPLLAECELALGAALNALGDFDAAIALLESAAARFLAHARPDDAARCACELAALYAEIGQLDRSEAVLKRAETLDRPGPLRAYYHRAEGLYHFEKNRHRDAAAALRCAAELFEAEHRIGELALTWCALAESLRYINPHEALHWIDCARAVEPPGEGAVYAARCDRILGWIRDGLNQYPESLKLYCQAQEIFAREEMVYSVAQCDLLRGIAHYRLNQFDQALQAYSRARDIFAAKAFASHVGRCDLNIAITYYSLNRYDEALEVYERVAAAASSEGRPLRAATCYASMGLCYDRLGRYDKALAFHERACAMAQDVGQPVSAARALDNLAGTYQRLGRYEEALQRCQQAREVYVQHNLPVDMAWCDAFMASLYLSLGKYSEAFASLVSAHAAYEQAKMPVQIAACQREMARAQAKLDQADLAYSLLDEARSIFAGRDLLVDMALCDVALGELYVSQHKVDEAAPLFHSALAVLDPGLPDEAWRAEYGLGQCAQARLDIEQALRHWLSAVRLTHRMRAALPTERLSGSFFATHRQLYEQTLGIALDLEQDESALVVAEAGKAQVFLNRADQHEGRGHAPGDPYLGRLLQRASQLKQQLAEVRSQLRFVQADAGVGEPSPRGGSEASRSSTEVLDQLSRLSHEYEGVVERLRIEAPGQFDASSPRLFSVQALRQAVQARLSTHWACLAYYLLDDRLIIFYLDAHQLKRFIKPLKRYDRKLINQCTNSDREFRQLLYGGELGSDQLAYLHDLLIPPQVAALGENDVLIIAPHAQLHALPFHTLRRPDGPLVNRVTMAMVPSLSVFEALLHRPDVGNSIEHVLALGLSEFGGRAKPLLHTRRDIAMLQGVFGGRLTPLWGEQATPEALWQRQQTGELTGYDVIHFATHTLLDRSAPSQSSVLLHGDSLACADILNLKLRARLTVLASCEGVLGRHYAGGEILSLAQAFFFAGARTVVASLWPVEDESTTELMRRFYRHLDDGAGAAGSLRAAQAEMAADGYTPYQWAPFVAVGLP